MNRTLARIVVLLCVAMIAGATSVSADEYPAKPIMLIVPFSQGGPTDTVGRLLAEAMSRDLGQRVRVQNVQGAGGTSGSGRVARAPADGYTLLIYHIGQATAPLLYPKMGYHPIDDFEPIGLVNEVPMVLVARKNFPVESVKSLLEYARVRKLIYAHAGIGSASHLCGLLLQHAAKINLLTTRYNGTGPALKDMIDGHVDVMCDQTTNTADSIKAGKIRVYGIATPRRIALLPNVPTLHESGLPNFEISIWHGIYAPRGTPKAVVERLTVALQAALRDPALIQRFAELGTDPVTQDRATPPALRAHLKAESERWAPIIREAGGYE